MEVGVVSWGGVGEGEGGDGEGEAVQIWYLVWKVEHWNHFDNLASHLLPRRSHQVSETISEAFAPG